MRSDFNWRRELVGRAGNTLFAEGKAIIKGIPGMLQQYIQYLGSDSEALGCRKSPVYYHYSLVPFDSEW